MFTQEVKKAFGANVPIFAEEILALFPQYTRAYVFRLIKRAEQDGELTSFCRGVYYIPTKTFLGASQICSEMVAEKKYLRDCQSVYGIYAGLSLLNQFGITTQVPNTVEIVTNRETTRKRKVTIVGRDFILRKARCEITKENFATYTLLQLFNDMGGSDKMDDLAREQILGYMKGNNVTQAKLFAMSQSFPSLVLRKIAGSGVLNETA